jgi:hypothetical protein
MLIKMSVEHLYEPPSSGPESLSAKMGIIENSRQRFFMCAKSYTRFPIKRRCDALGNSAQTLFNALRDTAGTISNLDCSDEEKKNLLVRLIEIDDRNRADEFNRLTDRTFFKPYTPEELDSIRQDILLDGGDDSKEQAVDFDAWASATLEAYSDIIAHEAVELIQNTTSRKIRMLELGSSVSKEAAKMTGAAVLAIYISRRIQSK